MLGPLQGTLWGCWCWVLLGARCGGAGAGSSSGYPTGALGIQRGQLRSGAQGPASFLHGDLVVFPFVTSKCLWEGILGQGK